MNKLQFLIQKKWWKEWETPEQNKTSSRDRLSPGPYLLLLGDPGTGKSLIGRALANKLTELYKKHEIQLMDVVCWENKEIPTEPRISIHKAKEGRKLVIVEKQKSQKKKRWLTWGFRLLQGIIIGFGIAILSIIGAFILNFWISNPIIDTAIINGVITDIPLQSKYSFLEYLVKEFMAYAQMLYLGIGALSMGAMLFIFKNILGRGLTGRGNKGIGGAEATEAPKLLIDNTACVAPFVDATGHGSSQLFGSIAWDPFQTGGLGTPEHQRVTAGDVHKACLGILYIDEIKNLQPTEAVTLLTVLEDGQLPVTLRGSFHGGETAAMSVATEPIPTVTFLVAAGNFDSINRIHPALMDRIYGYGKVVRMNNDMPNSIENRRKYVQFISQEIKRFNLIPFSRGACIEIINEGRRRSGKREALTTKFRPLISIIKTSSVLAMNEGLQIVERKHVKEAIEEHCLTIRKQLLEHYMEETSKFEEIDPTGEKLGQVYGLAVVEDPVSEEATGSILRLKAQMEKRSKFENKNLKGYYKVTGIAKGEKEKYIADSVAKVRSVILKKYGIDIAQETMTHLDFSQSYGTDGPSAGVTMTLALCSLIEGKPLRQDVAVTGEINISSDDEIEVTAVGGLYEKIKAAEKQGFKKVIIPYKNYKYSINPKDFKIEVIPGKNLDDYLKIILVSS